MENFTLELNINSASNLVNVNLITKMDVYAAITIHDDNTQKKQKVKTSIDRSGGSNPTWNHAVKFSINEKLARDGRFTLIMRLMSRRILGNKKIGEVNIPILELLNSIISPINDDSNDQEMKVMTYQVRNLSGKRMGTLTFSYRFKTDSPVVVNHSSVDIVDTPLTVDPPSQIKHSTPSAPPELPFEFPTLTQPMNENNFDHHKHPFVAGSSNDPLPVSYGAMMEPSYFYSPPYDQTGHTYNHSPPPLNHQGYEQYGYASPSPPRYRYGDSSIGFGLGLRAGIMGGLMTEDIVSDVANCYEF